MLGTCDWCEGATWRWGEQQGGGCVVETELEIGGEWWVHSGNVVAIYLEVTVGLTNEGDLLQYLHSLFYTETYIASPLMNPDSLLEGSVVGGCWMGVPLALLGLVVEEEKYCFSCTINSSLSKHPHMIEWHQRVDDRPHCLHHPSCSQTFTPRQHRYDLHNRACTPTGLIKPTLKVCAKRESLAELPKVWVWQSS